MIDRLSLNSANHAVSLDAISFYAYQTLLAVQQQQPELLVEKYRRTPWSHPHNQAIFRQKLHAELNQAGNFTTLTAKIQKFLQPLLSPAFFESGFFQRLLQQLQKTANSAVVHRPSVISAAEPELSLTSVVAESGIAILLLDAENLQITSKTEKLLANICQYPIQIKIAFANWRNMGKQDVDLHNRSYELIHVPAGKDSADVKMATVGSSIFIHYPNAREVLVCSSDRVMTHLATTLQTHGLTVYLVRKQADNLAIFNSKTGQTQLYSPKPLVVIPSLSEFILQFQEVVQTVQASNGNQWIKLSSASQIFHKKYALTISQVLNRHKPGSKIKDLLLEYGNIFAIHQRPDESEIYITLFKSSSLEIQSGESEISVEVAVNSLVEKTDSTEPDQEILPINSPEELERLLVKIINSLATPSRSSILLRDLGAKFYKEYGQSINQVIKQLQAGANLSKFLQSRSAFNLVNIANEDRVAIALPSSPKGAEITSPEELEQIVISIIDQSTTAVNPYLPLSNLGTEFQKLYGESIILTIQRLQAGTSLTKFLESRDIFDLDKTGKGYKVAKASLPSKD
jgi:hypothetical protein